MEKYIRYSIITFILIFVILGIIAIFTNSLEVLSEANTLFLALSALFFLFSIVFWVISWVYLLKKHAKIVYLEGLIVGISCVYGALTPIQVGSEALRSIKAKEIWGINYKDSVSSAMLIKGIKFSLLAILASIILILILVETKLSLIMVFGLLSGFLIILLATSFFLLPINKTFSKIIQKFFDFISKKIKKLNSLSKYFNHYSTYLQKVSLKDFLIVFLLAFFSFIFEVVALYFSFLSLNVLIEFIPLMVLFVIISILERTPVLPRGIGIVEAAGFIFLSLPEFSNLNLEVSQIAAIIIVFSISRLIIPTIVSLIFASFKIKKIDTKK